MEGNNKRIYRARAKTWGLGESSSGNEQVGVEFEISTPDADVKNITWYGHFTEKTLERTVESLRFCGFKGDDLEKLEGLDANEVDLVIEDEEYQGRVYPRVKWVNRVGGLSIKTPLTGDRAKSFAATMKDKIRALDAAKGQKKPTPTAASPAQPGAWGADDIPF